MADARVEDIDRATRRKIAGAISSQRKQLLAHWEERHRAQPSLAEPVRALGGWDAYRSGYLDPLLRLLSTGIRRASPDHLYVYAHERTRFFDPAALRNGGQAELAATLRGDAEDTLALFDGQTAEAHAVRALLDALHGSIVDEPGAASVSIVLVGDCLMTDVIPFLRPQLRAAGLELTLDHLYFSAHEGRALAQDELIAAIDRERYTLIGLSFLTYEGIPPYPALLADAERLSGEELTRRVDQIDAVVREYIGAVREATNATIVLHGASGLPLTKLREFVPLVPPLSRGRRRAVALLDSRLRELAANTENVIFLDEAQAVSAAGLRAASRRLMSRVFTHGGVFHPSAFGPLIAAPYADVVTAHSALSKCKVLLVDFDNTLWDGVMAEGEVEHHLEAQRLLRRLREAGILLVSVSKNDPESIRWDELELDYDDFVLHKVSWNLKSQSIEEAAGQLDLGLDSFVLIDDNPVERELVASALPAVRTMDPADPATWRRLGMMLDFPNTRATAEAARRTEMYREAAARRDAVSGGADYAGMMRTLDLRVGFGPAREKDLDRVHELIDRTNQFNTTTIRRSRSELSQLLSDPAYGIYLGTLADKFGELGVVGVTVVRRDGDALVFDAVIMSCRAMGFGFETVLLRGPIDAETGFATAVGHYVPTERNRPCAALFSEKGFREAAPGEWRLDLGGALPEIPDWLALTRV